MYPTDEINIATVHKHKPKMMIDELQKKIGSKGLNGLFRLLLYSSK